MQHSRAKITPDNECLRVSGDIDFVSAISLWQASLAFFAKSQNLLFDFSDVTTTNSAALVLLIEWLRLAKNEKKSIVFHSLPSQLLSLASVVGIDQLLVRHMQEKVT